MGVPMEHMGLPQPEPPDIAEAEADGTFDVNAARRAGYSFTEIADYLAKDSDFDLKGAREAGYEDAEIVSYLTRGKGFDRSGGPVHAGLRGLYGGAADVAGMVLGAPVDAANWALRKVGVPIEPSDAMTAPRRALAGVPTPSGGTTFTYESLEDLPPGERPFAVGGEAVGASVPIAGAPLAAVRAGMQGPKLMRPIMDAARTRPGQFMAAEAGSMAGAAQGGALAETFRPGDPVARFAGEAGGAFVNPLGAASRVVGGVTRTGKRFAQGFTESGRESAAADVLQGALREAGEDPAAIARTLTQPDVTPGVEGLTAGQKTASPTLLAVEANLARRSPHFRGEARKAADEGLASLRTAVDDLVRSGDPESLKRVAELRERYFSELLGRRITAALRQADEASAKLPQRGRAQAHDPSIEAEQALQEALRDARGVETQLWGAIDKGVPVRPQALRAAHGDVRAQLLPEERLDRVTEAFLRRTAPLRTPKGAKAPDTPTSGEMLRFRKHLLTQAREAKSKNNPDISKVYEDLARGVLSDLDQVPGTATTTARQYSKALNDTFTRTFAGEAMAVRSSGAQIIPPEAVLERAFRRGGSEADVRFRQMVDAAGFGPNDLSPRMASAQERFIRVMAAETRDNAGRVDPNKLQAFMADNANLIERFPGLQADLADVTSAERLFREVETATTRASKAIRNKAAFSRLVEAEDPVRVVGEALADRRAPGRAYEGLVKVARRGNDNAVAGLKSATLEHAARQATGADGAFSFARYGQAMEGGPRQRGLLDLMESHGVMSSAETTRMRHLVKEAQKIETALTSRTQLDELVDAPDALIELVLRITGARLGTAVSTQSIGHGLIAAHAGSKFMRQLFDKVPRTRIMDVLEAASRDRKLMTALLTKPTTQAQAKVFGRQINAAMIQAGLTHDIDEDDLPMEGGLVGPELQQQIGFRPLELTLTTPRGATWP